MICSRADWETLCLSLPSHQSLSLANYVARQAPPSMGFSRQEYWSGLPFPPPGDLPDPGIEPRSPTLQVDSLQSEPPGKPHQWLVKINSRIDPLLFITAALIQHPQPGASLELTLSLIDAPLSWLEVVVKGSPFLTGTLARPLLAGSSPTLTPRPGFWPFLSQVLVPIPHTPPTEVL